MPGDSGKSLVLRSSPIPMGDQYADGKAAQVWELFIGDKNSRTSTYRSFLVNLLRERGCKRILDVACGTGIDSVMLVEEGFQVVSIDASDKMLKYALKTRWDRRKEANFDRWVIEEANWLTLSDDIQHILTEGHFDAVICLGNSFAHMLDTFGDQREQKQAINHFKKCLKPGGLLLIDHRNYDAIIETGQAPSKCIYYNSSLKTDITSSVLYVGGAPQQVILDYEMHVGNGEISNFRLFYHPHMLKTFSGTLQEIFGKSADHLIYGDFQPLELAEEPGFFIHVIERND